MSPVIRGATASKTTRSAPRTKGRAAPAKGPGRAAAGPARLSRRVPGSKKIVATVLPGFSRQMAAMISAGMPIVATLEALESQSDNPNFKRVITSIRASIENGQSLSEALHQFPSIFDHLYVSMVRGGEQSGELSETISRLANFLESSAQLRRKVKSAMMYPTIVLCIALALAVGIITFIVPVFGEMFQDFGAKLPGPTQFLLNLSGGIRKYGIFIVIGLVIVVIAFRKWKKTPAGAYALDDFVLKLPVFGELARKVTATRFARTLGQMIRSGVPILQALQISAGACGNQVATRVVNEARSTVEKGEPLSVALVNQTVFPIMLVRMLQAGEKTGRIDEMMDNIADFYDDEVQTMLSGLTSLLEPLLMVFLGIIIGGIVLCLFLPIFKMSEIINA